VRWLISHKKLSNARLKGTVYVEEQERDGTGHVSLGLSLKMSSTARRRKS
jgi:hypothetical protein